MSARLRCRLLAFPGPRPSISLAFELENPGPETWRGGVLEPLVPWDLRAWVAGHEVVVSQPTLDLPVRERQLELEPGRRVELPCPIVLVFDESPDHPPSSLFTWSLVTRPAAVELQASVKAGDARLLSERTSVTLPGMNPA